MPIRAERGYLIPAINIDDCDYVACAEQLARSIREWHPTADITIVTRADLPHGDQGGFANDWQMFEISPYRQTIKLEADMWCASAIDHLWSLFEHRDVVISQGCRNYQDQVSGDRRYRRVFDANELPDVYNAVTYWRLSRSAQQFFATVRSIFDNWAKFRTTLIMPDDQPTTDVVYAMAALILGPETVTLPASVTPRMVHMKKNIIGTTTDDWRQELVWEKTHPGLRINTVAQWGLVHYYHKDWT